ncbi:MAG: DUF4965 domain-containing protein [Oscillospiraceae bacterium]|nr:DUF4965 domain-containing protein [Oscillospiraceae bacterium]
MKMRAPAVPLIVNDPYFSIWSMEEALPGFDTYHWTASPHRLTGTLFVDGEPFVFLGKAEGTPMKETLREMDLFTSTFLFETDKAQLMVEFTSPLIPQMPDIMARPVSYLTAFVQPKDGEDHDFRLQLTVCDEVCLERQFDCPTEFKTGTYGSYSYCTLANELQRPLSHSGDDMRIRWGTFCMATQAPGAEFSTTEEHRVCMTSKTAVLTMPVCGAAVVAFGYDDIKALSYFGTPVEGWWRQSFDDLFSLMEASFEEYSQIMGACQKLSDEILLEAERIGGEKYRDLLALSWRQTMAAHKLAADPAGKLICISKECFSDGDAATVDVTYPSAPVFLMYAPELLRGMLAPVFEYAASDAWEADCAPHDLGIYPILDGQQYKDPQGDLVHMPVEECGNMLILTAAYVKASGDTIFAAKQLPLLEQWVKYLETYGIDPEDQLCTDDFAGKSPHNCNLTLKAIFGVAGYGMIHGFLGNKRIEAEYLAKAKELADSWCVRAEGKGCTRRAFDRPDSFSLKYNMIWDKVFGLGLFSRDLMEREVRSYVPKMNTYGVPLDERADYTKSDWIVWCACMTDDRSLFETLVAPVWQAYNDMDTRFPMGDWYNSVTGRLERYPDLYADRIISFQNRSVQGAMVMPLLVASGKLKV